VRTTSLAVLRSWIPRSCDVSRGPQFWRAYYSLPSDIQELARKAYRLCRDDPQHPSLQFKRVHDADPIYAVRVTLGYRALGLLQGDLVVWFWIGSHAEYDRLLSRL
jgi:hypothetical protein